MQVPSADSARPPRDARRHRPLIPVLVGFACGIGLDGSVELSFVRWAALGCAALVVAMWAALRGRKSRLRWLAAALLLLPMGGAWHAFRFRHRPPWHLMNLLTRQTWRCHVRGKVSAEPHICLVPVPFPGPGREARRLWLCRTDVEALSPDGMHWIRASGRLTVFVETDRPDVLPGDEIRFLGTVRGNRPATNPGEPDSRIIYARQGEHGTANVPCGAAFEVRRRPPWYGSVRIAMGRLRSYLKGRLIWNTDRPLHPLAGALIFAERSRLTPGEKQAVEESGALHFLAVSGLHVGILAAFIWGVLAWVPVRIQVRVVVLIALVWFYVLLTGLRVAAVRAGLMLTLIAVAPLLGRRSDGLSGLLAAALIILTRWPQSLFTPGFQYTFVAVWAIYYLYRGLARVFWPWDGLLLRLQHPSERSLWDDLWRYARHYLLLSGCIWLAVAPLAAYHFHRCSFLAPLTNLLVWPLMLVLILSSLGAAALAPIGGIPLAAMMQLTEFLGRRIMDLLEAAAGLRALVVYTAGPPLWWIGFYYAVLGLWVMRVRLGGGRRVFVAGVLALCATYVVADVAVRRADQFTVTVADVGHGQCLVFRSPSGGVMLYDAGSAAPNRARAVAGILWCGRLGRIDAMVISHRDADHCSFAPFLARRFRVGAMLMTPAADTGDPIERGLDSLGLRRTALVEGNRVKLDGLRCDVLHPDPMFLAAAGLSSNERSLVLMCRAGGWRLLLCGDIERLALARLAEDYGEALRADVLLLPHHGAWEPGLRRFVEHVQPKVAVASCYDAVEERTRHVLEELGVPLWTTARHGATIMTLGDGELRLTGFCSGQRRRFVQAPSGGLVPEPTGAPTPEGL